MLCFLLACSPGMKSFLLLMKSAHVLDVRWVFLLLWGQKARLDPTKWMIEPPTSQIRQRWGSNIDKEHEGVQCPMKKCKCHYQMGSVSKKNNNLIIESPYSNPGQDGNSVSRIKMMLFLFPMFSRFPTVRHRFEGCYTPAGRSWEFTTYHYTNTGGTWTSLGRFFLGSWWILHNWPATTNTWVTLVVFVDPTLGLGSLVLVYSAIQGPRRTNIVRGLMMDLPSIMCHMDLFGSPDWSIAWIDLEMVRPGLTHRMMWWLKASQFLWRGQQHVWK